MAYSRRMGVSTGCKRVPRYLRNEDIPRDTFTPRTYQVELLDSALHRNTVVCMGSSSGRMFIAMMLMKEMAEKIRNPVSEGGKRSVYLANTDAIVRQHSPSIQHPADFKVSTYTENMGVTDWMREKWTAEINRSEVLVMTGTIFLKLLVEDILSMDTVNLLVIDDCHLTLEEHPYQHIMAIYKQTEECSQPRILGLTSSVIAGKFQNPESLGDMITSLEEVLQSTAETSTLVISERFGIKPNEVIIECMDYEDTTGLKLTLCTILEDAIDFLDECNIEVSQELDNRDPGLIPKAALIECHNILTHLGPWCAACLADMLVGQIEKIEKQKEFVALHKKFLKIGATTLRMVSKIFDDHFKNCDYTVEDLLKYSTPKVAALMKCLRKYRPETDFIIVTEELEGGMADGMGSDSEISDDESDFSDNENDDVDDDVDDEQKSPGSKQVHVAIRKVPPEAENKTSDMFSLDEDKYLCGIVFVDRQHEAYALNKLIEEICAWDDQLCFVKSSHMAALKKEKKMYKKHEEILRKFRMQELNLLVSTNVLEEGVDVPKCNLVVRFDVPRTYRSYSQSKGRARARDAEFVILIEEEHFDQFQSELKTYKQIEQVLLRQFNKPSDDSSSEVEDNIFDSPVMPYIPSSEEINTKVTLDTAIMLVNRYCAKLPSDAFTHLTPTCTIRELIRDEHTLYAASLRLPINSPIKVEIEGVPMTSKLKAKQAVALKMCEILHKQGELDDNLMPVGKEMFQGEEGEEEELFDEEEDMLGEARPGTTKRKQYYCKKVAGSLLQSHPMPDTQSYLYVINMKLTGAITDDQNTRGRQIYAPEDTPRCFGILTSKLIPQVPMFPVFTRSGEVTVSVEMLSTDTEFSVQQLTKLKTFHKFLFSNVLRLEKDPMDFEPLDSAMGYIVVPLTKADAQSPLEIDWDFTEKVELSLTVPPKSKDSDTPFSFKKEDYEDAVVMPSYRNIDQPQYFYVAEIRNDLNPSSPFPSPELYKTFSEYYTTKYGLSITNQEQPLLDVDHTSARLNLLIPRYMNQKGVPLPTSSAETKKARRENLQQKQILVPELCDIHVFLASLWRKAVCLPAILYRTNYLLLAEEIRKHVAAETKIGIVELTDGFRFPRLDFGFDTSPENLKPLTDNKNVDTKTEVSEEEMTTGEDDSEVNTSDVETADDTLDDRLVSDQTDSKYNTCFKDDKEENQHKTGNGQCAKDVPANESNERADEPLSDDKQQVIDNHLTFQKNGSLICDFCIIMGKELGSDKVTVDVTSCPKCAKLRQEAEDFNKATLKTDVKVNMESENDANSESGKYEETDSHNKKDIESANVKEAETELEKQGQIKSIKCNGYHPNSLDTCIIEKGKKTAEISDKNRKTANTNSLIANQDGLIKDKEQTAHKLNNVLDLKLDNMECNEMVAEGTLEKPVQVNGWGEVINDEVEILRNTRATITNCSSPVKNKSENQTSILDLGNAITDQNQKNYACNGNKTDSVKELIANKVVVCKLSDPSKGQSELIQAATTENEIKFQGENCDVFANVGKFECEKKAGNPDIEDENDFPETLISLDEDINLSTYVGPSPCVILQALTMSNANDFFSLERLETIGDSFLKYAITVYLYCSYPGIHEGKLSYLRSKQVSNYNLYRLGKRKGLAECMISTKFEPYENWLAPGYVVNEDKRKGPVPKVHVSNLSMSRNSSAIFSSQSSDSLYKMGGEENEKGDAPMHIQSSEVRKFDKELEEVDQIAKDEELEKVVNSCVQQNLQGYCLQLHHCLPDKSIADCVEALIGCYLTSCDKMAALRFMSWMGLKVLPKKEKSKDDKGLDNVEFEKLPCPQSPFLAESRGAERVLCHLLDGYDGFEEKIGYKFCDRSYLLQAFTHASYHYNTVTDCYQRLEFLGDAVLDYVITRHLYEDSCMYTPGVLTDLRSALVNNNIFAALAVKWDFHKYFKAISPALFHVIEKFVARQKEKEDEIDIEDEETDEDQDKEHVELEVPKALGDIFESVAGAIYLDSGMSLDVVWGVFYRIMNTQIEKYLKSIPKSPVRELLEQEPETAKFDKPERTMDGKIRVTVNVVGKGVYTGVGRNYRIAKSAAAKKALRCIKTLEQQGLI